MTIKVIRKYTKLSHNYLKVWYNQSSAIFLTNRPGSENTEAQFFYKQCYLYSCVNNYFVYRLWGFANRFHLGGLDSETDILHTLLRYRFYIILTYFNNIFRLKMIYLKNIDRGGEMVENQIPGEILRSQISAVNNKSQPRWGKTHPRCECWLHPGEFWVLRQ